MALVFELFIFILGLIVGSFLNCVIYRLEIGESFLEGRSYCPDCQKKLSWRDLIPVFSFLILKGKCRYCRQKISWQYPIVEIAAGILFLAIYQFTISGQQLTPFYIINFFFLLVVFCFLIIIFVYDLKYYIIPDKVIYPAILVSGIWYFVSSIFFNTYSKYEILNTLCSAIGAAAFFLAIVLISRGKWMGAGDIKLAFLMGLILSFPNILVALFLAFLLGAIIGTGLIISGKKRLSSEVPFAPFLVVGTLAALFWGQNLLNWYLNILGFKL